MKEKLLRALKLYAYQAMLFIFILLVIKAYPEHGIYIVYCALTFQLVILMPVVEACAAVAVVAFGELKERNVKLRAENDKLRSKHGC